MAECAACNINSTLKEDAVEVVFRPHENFKAMKCFIALLNQLSSKKYYLKLILNQQPNYL